MKSVKNLLVPSIILVVLAIFSIVYFSIDSFKRNAANETANTIYDVVNYKVSDVASVSLSNNEKGFNLKVVKTAKNDGSMLLEYKGDDADPKEKYSQNKLLRFLEDMIYISSADKVSESGNYADFGLDKPFFTVNIELSSGQNVTYYLGNISDDSDSCFIYVNGSNDVFKIYCSKDVLYEKSSVKFLEEFSIGIDLKEVKTVHFDRKTDGLSLDANVSVTDTGISVFDVYEPYVHGTSGYFGNLIDAVAGLTVDDFVAFLNNNLKEYSLDDPAYHFAFTKYNGNKVELFLSKNINGYHFGYVKGINKIFVVHEYRLEGLNLQELILIDPYICYCYVKDIKTITGTYGDQSFKFELDVPVNSSIMDSNSTVTLDGRNAKVSDTFGRSYCSILFESIACIKIGGVDVNAKPAVSGGPALTLTFYDKNYATTVYEFYTRDQDSYYVVKNGEYMGFFVYASEIFNDGGSDTYNYGFWKAYELLTHAISENMNGIYDL